MDGPVFGRLDTALLRVRDLEASRAWYEHKLGLEAVHVETDAALVVFEVGGAPPTKRAVSRPAKCRRRPASGSSASTDPEGDALEAWQVL